MKSGYYQVIETGRIIWIGIQDTSSLVYVCDGYKTARMHTTSSWNGYHTHIYLDKYYFNSKTELELISVYTLPRR